MALHRKFHALAALKPDIAFIQECAAPHILREKNPDIKNCQVEWHGKNKNKGLGIFSFSAHHKVGDFVSANSSNFALAGKLGNTQKFHLLNIWACHQTGDTNKLSLGPSNLILDEMERFINAAPTIIAGDFNNNVLWDKDGFACNFGENLKRLTKMGLKSSYHEKFKVGFGKELHPTIYWRDRTKTGPTYHIDYVFIPANFPAQAYSIQVGSHEDWVEAKLSDHVPLILDIDQSRLF